METVPSCQLPPPEPLPSAAISGLTEPLEPPLGPLMSMAGVQWASIYSGMWQGGRVSLKESL